MTSTVQLNKRMRKRSGFMGTYSFNQIPNYLPVHSCYIVNVDTENLPGKHWIAVMRGGDDYVKYFDPLGQIPLRPICQNIQNLKILYTLNSAQNIYSMTSGQHCVYFLYNFLPALNDAIAVNFVNKFCL